MDKNTTAVATTAGPWVWEASVSTPVGFWASVLRITVSHIVLMLSSSLLGNAVSLRSCNDKGKQCLEPMGKPRHNCYT